MSNNYFIARHFVPGFLLLLMLPPRWGSAQTQPRDSSKAYISVHSNVSGASIFLDGAAIGHTPLTDFLVAVGQHELVVRRDQATSWFAKDWHASFTIQSGDSLAFTASFDRVFFVRSQPFGAKIFLDGVAKGSTPAIIEISDTLAHTVEIIKEGFQPAHRLLSPSVNPFVDVELVMDDAFSVDQNMLQKTHKDQQNHLRRYAFLSAGLSLTSAVAGILLKSHADHLYKSYQMTLNPNRMDELFADTQRYDTYSSLAYGVFQASFAVSFYLFLKSAHH